MAYKPSITLEPLSPLGPPDPSIPKAAEMIGVSDRTMRRAVERGEIEAYKLLGSTRVKLALTAPTTFSAAQLRRRTGSVGARRC